MKNTNNKFITLINKNTFTKALAFVVYSLALLCLFILIINSNVVGNTKDRIYSVDSIDMLSNDYDCILILGAGIKRDGSPTDMLYDRLKAGFDAYNEGIATFIFLSGDSENSDYTETVTMNNVLTEMGVNSIHIISDGYGLSTYDSIWRAYNVYGFTKILIVSQKYHLPRAIYIAEKLGLEADGLDAALRGYKKQPIYTAREYLARIKDVIFCELGIEPTYTERWENVYE